jgi:hypothetical protein
MEHGNPTVVETDPWCSHMRPREAELLWRTDPRGRLDLVTHTVHLDDRLVEVFLTEPDVWCAVASNPHLTVTQRDTVTQAAMDGLRTRGPQRLLGRMSAERRFAVSAGTLCRLIVAGHTFRPQVLTHIRSMLTRANSLPTGYLAVALTGITDLETTLSRLASEALDRMISSNRHGAAVAELALTDPEMHSDIVERIADLYGDRYEIRRAVVGHQQMSEAAWDSLLVHTRGSDPIWWTAYRAAASRADAWLMRELIWRAPSHEQYWRTQPAGLFACFGAADGDEVIDLVEALVQQAPVMVLDLLDAGKIPDVSAIPRAVWAPLFQHESTRMRAIVQLRGVLGAT